MFKPVVPAYVSPAYEREKNPYPEDGHHTKIPHFIERKNKQFQTGICGST